MDNLEIQESKDQQEHKDDVVYKDHSDSKESLGQQVPKVKLELPVEVVPR